MEISDYIIMTDDCNYARKSIYKNNENSTFTPIISCPRAYRPDMKFEILRRIRLLHRYGINEIHYKGDDYDNFNNAFKSFNIRFVNIDDDIAELEIGSSYELLSKLNYTAETNNNLKLHKNDRNIENSIMIIEKTELIYDSISILWANYYNYDILLIDEISDESIVEVESLLGELVEADGNYQRIIDKLSLNISTIYNYQEIQKRYSSIQFITRNIFLSIPIIDIIAATIPQVECGIKLLGDCVNFNHQSRNELPIFLFVDVGDEKITSEIPQVEQIISTKSQWSFHLSKKDASVFNLKLFCKFFPFDFLHLSGHGSSPNVRIVEYEFEDPNSLVHRVKLIEYYQLLRQVKDKFEVETQQQFLEVDGVDWSNKEAISKLNFSLPDFINSRNSRAVKTEPYNSNILQGIQLNNGIFFGNINHFANMDSPLLFLNTCGSHMRVSNYLTYAGARATIGSVWSIFDKSAVDFSNVFFNELNNSDICTSFLKAKTSLTDNYTKFAYQFIGTLNCNFNSGIVEYDIMEQTYLLTLKFIESLEFSLLLKRFNLISEDDLQSIEKIFNIAELMSHKNDKNKINISTRLKAIRSSFEF